MQFLSGLLTVLFGTVRRGTDVQRQRNGKFFVTTTVDNLVNGLSFLPILSPLTLLYLLRVPFFTYFLLLLEHGLDVGMLFTWC